MEAVTTRIDSLPITAFHRRLLVVSGLRLDVRRDGRRLVSFVVAALGQGVAARRRSGRLRSAAPASSACSSARP